jgi:hypothetical protein
MILFTMNACAFATGYRAISLRPSFHTMDVALVAYGMRGFSTGKFATGHTLMYTRALVFLALINARCRSLCLRYTCKSHQQQCYNGVFHILVC